MKPFLIGVAGPSCSGKSVLIKEVWEKGGGISRIKVDNYWKNKNTFPRKLGYRNWDLPESRKFNLLYKNLLELKVGKKTKIPICKKGQFDHFELFEPTPIIIVEGLFLFADKKISDLFDLKIYVHVPKKVSIDRKIERTRQNWVGEKYVKIATEYSNKVYWPQYKQYIKPFKAQSDLILNGTMDIKTNAKKILEVIKNETVN